MLGGRSGAAHAGQGCPAGFLCQGQLGCMFGGVWTTMWVAGLWWLGGDAGSTKWCHLVPGG